MPEVSNLVRLRFLDQHGDTRLRYQYPAVQVGSDAVVVAHANQWIVVARRCLIEAGRIGWRLENLGANSGHYVASITVES